MKVPFQPNAGRERFSESHICEGFWMQLFCGFPAYVFGCCCPFAWCTPKRRFGVFAGWSMGLFLAGIILLSLGLSLEPFAQQQLDNCQQSNTVPYSTWYCQYEQQDLDLWTGCVLAGYIIGGAGLFFGFACIGYYCARLLNHPVCPKCKATNPEGDICRKCGTSLWLYPRTCTGCNRFTPAQSPDKACSNCGIALVPIAGVPPQAHGGGCLIPPPINIGGVLVSSPSCVSVDRGCL